MERMKPLWREGYYVWVCVWIVAGWRMNEVRPFQKRDNERHREGNLAHTAAWLLTVFIAWLPPGLCPHVCVSADAVCRVLWSTEKHFAGFLLVCCISLHFSREQIFEVLCAALPGGCTAPGAEAPALSCVQPKGHGPSFTCLFAGWLLPFLS